MPKGHLIRAGSAQRNYVRRSPSVFIGGHSPSHHESETVSGVPIVRTEVDVNTATDEGNDGADDYSSPFCSNRMTSAKDLPTSRVSERATLFSAAARSSTSREM